MKMRKCPYCGRRISYTSAFASRRKAEFVCQKCGKESKVVVNKKVILIFVVAAVSVS
jgi:transposase-like protein